MERKRKICLDKDINSHVCEKILKFSFFSRVLRTRSHKALKTYAKTSKNMF